jgi:UBA-like domain
MLTPKQSDIDQPMLSQDELLEQQKVDQVMSIMEENDPEVARRILRKCNGDVERAITAMLSGDTGAQDPQWPISAVDFDLKYPPTRSQSRVFFSHTCLVISLY